jgi:branched-chain amino acid transport system permease protein
LKTSRGLRIIGARKNSRGFDFGNTICRVIRGLGHGLDESAIAAAGGLMYGLAYPVLDPYMGVRIGWWAFIAAVVGGIGNIRGAMLGGFILGAVEIFTPVFLPSSTYRDIVAFSLLLLLLVFKPTGLLGRPIFERV